MSEDEPDSDEEREKKLVEQTMNVDADPNTRTSPRSPATKRNIVSPLKNMVRSHLCTNLDAKKLAKSSGEEVVRVIVEVLTNELTIAWHSNRYMCEEMLKLKKLLSLFHVDCAEMFVSCL